MPSRARQAVAPVYLLLCLVLGGSAQGIWQNMALQLLGIAILGWAAWPADGKPLGRPARQLLVIAILAIALVALQMVPLPASLWTRLGGRGVVADGYHILGLSVPALPLSLTPYRSFDCLLALIPPVALFIAIVSLRAYRPGWLAGALLLGAMTGVVLGALQVSESGNIADSHWYIYETSSFGFGTGFFANANHMADLLACTLPFLAAILASALSGHRQRNWAILVAVAAAALLIVIGIALNHSLAVYGLTPPVLAASALILLPKRSAWRRWWALATAVLVVGAVAALATTSARTGQFGSDVQSSAQSREEMLSTTVRAMHDFLPWGSGVGSFVDVYHLYEDPSQVNGTYVIHAHNDYAEVALETGVPGILLMIAFLAWWGRATWRSWRYVDAGTYARAASIASGAILLHSIVDFPLRTAAISGVFAMCLGLLVERPVPAARSVTDLRPARHLVFR
ncbi:MAG: O-antigen ligase family protein [Sphingomicrobium sp.]